ncbi:MAG: hypothetical protein ABSC56_02500 [Solirubrobacteraceae bacterium]|jgi:hypothetical protein
MRRALGLIAATVASAATLAACGGGSTAGLLPTANENALYNSLTALESALANHDCSATAQALSGVQSELASLPTTVDIRLRQNLQTGYTTVSNESRTQCKPQSTGTGTHKTHTKPKTGNTGTSGATSATGTSQGGTTIPPTTGTSGTTGTTSATGATGTTSTGSGFGPGGGAAAPTGSSGTTGDSGGGAAG